jgi:signal peptide peptidase SppA
MANKMTLSILNRPWAITQDKMDEILDVYEDRLSGKKRDLEIVAAAIGKPLGNQDQGYTVTDSGVAVIPISGIIAKKMNLFSDISGGASTELIGRDIKAAMADPSVTSIVLDINSPGGTIEGLDALSNLIGSSKDDKCIIAYVDGQMCSAAYWIGSAASAIVASPTAQVGSIGILVKHTDYSKADEMNGVKRTYLTAGKYKALGNDAEPLSEFARQVIQERLDDAYTIFIDTVAKNRGTTAEKVLSDMADGRVFMGQKAVSAGLVDSLGTLDDALAIALEMSQKMATMPPRRGGMMQKQGATLKIQKEEHMDKFTTLAELVAAYPDFAAQLKQEAIASVDVQGPAKAASATEATRILGLAEAHFGKEPTDKFAAIVNSGTTVEQYAAFRVANPVAAAPAAAPEDTKKADLLAAIKASGAPPVGADAVVIAAANEDWSAQVDAYQEKHGCSRSKAIHAIDDANPGLREKYLARINTGKQKEAAHV